MRLVRTCVIKTCVDFVDDFVVTVGKLFVGTYFGPKSSIKAMENSPPGFPFHRHQVPRKEPLNKGLCLNRRASGPVYPQPALVLH